MFFLGFIALGVPALAQQSLDESNDSASSTIMGHVVAVGLKGECVPLSGVQVTLTASSTGKEFRSVATDADGHYQFDYLFGGSYKLEVRVRGFEPFDGIVLLGRDEIRVQNVVLHDKSVAQKVDRHDLGARIATRHTNLVSETSGREYREQPDLHLACHGAFTRMSRRRKQAFCAGRNDEGGEDTETLTGETPWYRHAWLQLINRLLA